MPGPAPQPGQTRGPDGNPWTSTDAGDEWWHGDTAAHPTITTGDAGQAATGRITIPDIMGADHTAPDEHTAGDEDRYDEPTDDVRAPAADTRPPAEPEPTRDHGDHGDHGGRRVIRPPRSGPGRDRAAQHQSELVAKLESSPFWLGGDEPGTARSTDGPRQPGRLGVPPRRVPPVPRRPALGLPALLLLAMAATFFAWVSAEPLWLAVGHGDRGTAVVTGCSGTGIGHRCRGDFTADDGHDPAPGVALLSLAADQRGTGSVVPARMVRDSGRAYAATNDLTLHLRWAVGVLMVLLTGLGIAAATGARRLETPRARRTAVLLSLAGPMALLAGFLAMTY